MGDSVGATLLKNGLNKNVVVKLDLSKATPILFASLNEDHGAVGKLEYPGPDGPVMIKGVLVVQKFYLTGLIQDVTINVQKVSNNISYLTDENGMSLYISLKDIGGKSTCDTACLTTWRPVLVSGKIIGGTGVNLSNLGIIIRPDGTHQVTYLGSPLYTFSKDVNPGDSNGHGLGGVWFLVSP
jgi:predicted lipoprotein with Yx(FWY)xxD motif